MLQRLPPVVLNLLIINGLVWLGQTLFPAFSDLLVLHKTNLLGYYPEGVYQGEAAMIVGGQYAVPLGFQPYQIVTYFFAHANFFHILFNMLALVMIGGAVELAMGSRRFLEFYLFSGIVAGIALAVFDPSPAVVLGASTAVSGVLVAFALLYPTARLILFPIPIPIQARYFTAGYFAISLLLFFSDPAGLTGNVSHFGHLMGMVAGALYFYGRRLLRF